MSTSLEIDCGGETVTLEKTDDGDIIFHGWDEETELAAIELGFEPSPCLMIWNAINDDRIDEVLRNKSRGGDVTAVEALLFVGASVNAWDRNARTSLHYAALEGLADVAKILLNAGAKFDATDTDGETPLHLSAIFGNYNITKILIDAGANVNVQNNYGDTILHHAAWRGRVDAVKILLNAGASVYAKDSWGHTPLGMAQTRCQTDVADVLESWIMEHGE